jgi:hypothetical protein
MMRRGILMSKRLTFLIGLLLFLLPFSSAEARVWVLQPDGSGDAPTIRAAIDSVDFGGDVIELMDGIYSGPNNRDLNNLGKSFLVRSQSGNPTSCIIDLEGNVDEWHWGIAYVEDG